MAATLEIGGNADGASKALKDVKAGTAEVAAEMKKADMSAEELKAEIEAIGRTEFDVDPIKQLRKELELSAKAAGDIGGGGVTGKLTALFSGVTAGIQVFKGLSQGVREFREYVRGAAEAGDEGFTDLDRTLTNVSGKFTALVSNAAQSNLGQMLLGGIGGFADAAVEGLASVLGVSTELEASAVRLANIHKQLASAEKVEADLRKSREGERLQNAVNQIDDLGRVNALVQKEIDLLKKLASEDKLTAEQQEKSRQKIGSLENRRRQLQSEAAAERRRQLEEQIRAEEAAAQAQYDAQVRAAEEYSRLQERLAKEEEARKVKEVRDTEAAERAKLEAADKAKAEYQRKVDELAGKDNVKGAVQGVQEAAGSIEALIRRLASNAGKEGTDEYRKAFRQATMQSRGGAKIFSDEQIAQAQQQNANAITQSLQGTAGVSDLMVDALNQNLQAAQQLDQNNAQVAQEVAQIRAQLAEVGKNTTRRAQTMGRKQ